MITENENTTETAEAPPATAEAAQFEVVQPDLFKDYIKPQDGDTIVIAENTPFDVWAKYTIGVLEFSRRSMRIVGQLLIFGERKYGEKYAQVVDAMRYSPKTLANATYVVGKVKAWHDSLSFAHHEIVAALPPKAQEELLTLAETEKLTVSKLKKARNEKYPEKEGKKPRRKASKTTSAPALDLKDEAQMLQSAHTIIAFLEQAEAETPFRKWSKARMEKWSGILNTFRKIHRRTGLVK